MISFRVLLIILTVFFSNMSFADDTKTFYHDRERGWYWYEEPPVEEDIVKEKEDKPSIVVVSTGKPMTAKEVIAKQKETFDNALAEAVVKPTKENILEYLAISKLVNDQGARFASAFKKTIWVTPEYDYSLQGRPTNTQAINAYTQKQVGDNYETLHEIAEEKGIIYFFRSDCPYCARFSPILKLFAEKFGFTVIPVAMDGKGTKDYPYPKHSDYMASRLKVTTVPAVFLIDPDANSVSTIGYGFNDWTALTSKLLFANEQMEAKGNSQLALGEVR